MDSLNPNIYNPFEGKKKSALYNQEQLDYIKQLLDIGWSVARICSTFGLSKESIKKRIEKNDWEATLHKRENRLSEKDLQEIKKMVDNGTPHEEIASFFDISIESLERRILNNKWHRSQRKNQYTFNENYFDNIDNEHKAYWLGFLMADGYILSKRPPRKGKNHESQSFGFSIGLKDKELAEKFKEDLEATNPINVYQSKNGGYKKDTIAVRILLTSQHAVDSLKKWGVVENKTFIVKMPDIKDELVPAFIRGYSDGDGSVVIRKNGKFSWSLVGTKELLGSILEFLGKENLKLGQKKTEAGKNNYQVNIFGNRQVEELLDYIYKDATIYLTRKYEKYKEMKRIN